MAPARFFESLRKVSEDFVENLQNYCKGGHHPILIGDFFDDGRYEIVHKLGYGGYSIVWLAYDHRKSRYAALKFLSALFSVRQTHILKPDGSTSPKSNCNELNMTRYVADNVDKIGARRFAVEVETFCAASVNGQHLVFVSPVHGPCLQEYMQLLPYTSAVAQEIALDAAKALRDLHKAGVVHGDFTTRNILLKLRNLDNLCPLKIEDCFGKLEEEEMIPIDGRIPKGSYPKVVYKEAEMCGIPKTYMTREVVIIDFGLSFQASSPPAINGAGSPYSYRAPEQMTILEARLYLRKANEKIGRLDGKIDIWALACDIFEIRTRKPLFPSFADDDTNEQTVLAVRDVMAEIWLEDEDDEWRYMGDAAGAYDKRRSLRSRMDNEASLSLMERSVLYDLLKKMLKRKPSHRIGIEEVIQHPWFTTYFSPSEVPLLRHEAIAE